MKVLFCAYDKPSHLATGPNAWLQRLVPDLRQTYGIEVHTFFIYSGDFNDCPTISFFSTHQLPISTLSRETLPYIADQVKALIGIVRAEHITVVVANLVIPAFYATRYLKRLNIPMIGVFHSVDAFYKGVIQKFIHGDIQDQLNVGVAVSDYIHQLCVAQPSQTSMTVIPCGTPLPKQSATKLENRALKVMYAGRIVIEAKQIIKLTKAFIDASKALPNVIFSIFGDGDEVPQIRQLLKDTQHHKVNYEGAIAPAEIMKYFAQHHIFTLMSDYEGMPIALMEAMACGVVPVCLEEASGINEIIDHGVNGFIVKNRGDDYQKHLQLLSDNTELWETMSKNAVLSIAQRYSTDITHKKWHNLLKAFATQEVKPVSIPHRIRLEGALLYYGDNRKPTQSETLQENFNDYWMRLRLFLRPRARIWALLKKRNL